MRGGAKPVGEYIAHWWTSTPCPFSFPRRKSKMKYQNSITSVVTLANAAELVARASEQVMGQQSTQTFAGSPLNKEMLLQLSVSNFNKTISQQVGE